MWVASMGLSWLRAMVVKEEGQTEYERLQARPRQIGDGRNLQRYYA
jgi:hypothetical protein